MGSASALHLSFRDHVHSHNAGQKDPGTTKSLEPQQGPRSSFDRPMVLFDQLIDRFGLAETRMRLVIRYIARQFAQ
jgi:hypothetical protein